MRIARTTTRSFTPAAMAIGAGAAMLAAGSAQAISSATFTADNHYSLYADYGGSIDFIGANESGSRGSTGGYNWSKAETFTFATPDTVYVAAWSDDRVAQGLVGQFNFDGHEILTGDIGWEVFATGIDLDTNAPPPGAALVADQIARADTDGLWELPYIGFENVSSTRPWGKIDGVSEDANWIWRGSGRGGPNPLLGNVDHDEFLIFRATVPAPGAAAVIALGSIAAVRRRRTA